MAKYRMLAELQKIARDEKREPTEADLVRINTMIYELENAIDTKAINETEAIKAEMEIAYQTLGVTKTPSELREIGLEYFRRMNNRKDKELMKLSKGERQARAGWWLYETYGISVRHGKRLWDNYDNLTTAEWVQKLTEP